MHPMHPCTRCTRAHLDLDERNLSFVRDDGLVRADGELRHHRFGELHERRVPTESGSAITSGMPRSLPTRIG